MTDTYGIRTHRVGRWWAIEVPELGIHTQARRLDQVEEMARDAIAATLDISEGSFELGVQIRLDEELERQWYAVQTTRSKADQAQRAAAVATAEFTYHLATDQGFRTREIAKMLGISHQRVSQLLEAHRQGVEAQAVLDELTRRRAGNESSRPSEATDRSAPVTRAG